jgi:hypothetical protein
MVRFADGNTARAAVAASSRVTAAIRAGALVKRSTLAIVS